MAVKNVGMLLPADHMICLEVPLEIRTCCRSLDLLRGGVPFRRLASPPLREVASERRAASVHTIAAGKCFTVRDALCVWLRVGLIARVSL